MAKLVAFYSRADENYFGGTKKYISEGNTKKAAEKIAELTGADLFEIAQEVLYAADYDTCIAEAKRDLKAKARPKVKNLPESLDAYDEIYLGYPNYWGTMPMAVYTFLEHFDFSGKKIHPFCTHEGSRLSRTEQDIKNVTRNATVERGLAIHGSSVDGARAAIKKWIVA